MCWLALVLWDVSTPRHIPKNTTRRDRVARGYLASAEAAMKKPCVTCQRLIPLGVTRCAKCASAKQRRYDAQRGSAAARGYGAEWRMIRDAVIAKQPFCPCGLPSMEVDHIVPLRAGGTNSMSNLMALCKHCHSGKTCREDGGFGNA